MQIKEITKEQLDQLAGQTGLPAGQFLQSGLWQDFTSLFGRQSLCLGVYDSHELIAGCLLVQYDFPLGKKYFNCIRGPVLKFQISNDKCQINDQIPNSKCRTTRLAEDSFYLSNQKNGESRWAKSKIQNIEEDYDSCYVNNYRLPITDYRLLYQKITQKIAEYLQENYGQNNTLFMRIEPPVEGVEFTKWQKNIAVKKTKTVWPKKTLVLDLKKSEEQLLNETHPKWRYNIRLAKRKGVVIEKSSNVDDFYVLARETAQRDKIKFFNRTYFEKLLSVLEKNQAGGLWLAKYQGQAISGIINVYYGNTATYFFGASSDKHRNVMPNHLIQWQTINVAKKRGCEYYDFWGIAENNNPSNSFVGITRFKKGFGGFEISYGQSHDFIFSSFWYKAYNVMRKFYKL